MCWASHLADETEHEQNAIDALRAELSTWLAEVDSLKIDLGQKDADLAAWQAHSAGLAVMIKALEELVEAYEDVDYALEVALELIALCGNAGLPANMGEHESGNRRRTNAARDKVQAARAKVEELRGENP